MTLTPEREMAIRERVAQRREWGYERELFDALDEERRAHQETKDNLDELSGIMERTNHRSRLEYQVEQEHTIRELKAKHDRLSERFKRFQDALLAIANEDYKGNRSDASIRASQLLLEEGVLFSLDLGEGK